MSYFFLDALLWTKKRYTCPLPQVWFSLHTFSRFILCASCGPQLEEQQSLTIQRKCVQYNWYCHVAFPAFMNSGHFEKHYSTDWAMSRITSYMWDIKKVWNMYHRVGFIFLLTNQYNWLVQTQLTRKNNDISQKINCQ